jgi:hypothetical protein
VVQGDRSRVEVFQVRALQRRRLTELHDPGTDAKRALTDPRTRGDDALPERDGSGKSAALRAKGTP